MMKTVLAASAAVIALGAASAAQAQTAQAQAYATIGGGYYLGDDTEIPLVNGRVGVNIGQYFGVEAEAATGLDSDTNAGVEQEIDHILAAFGRVRGQVAPNVELFARLGYYTMDVSATAAGVTVDADDDDFAAGVGAEFALGDRTGLRLDYTNYGFDDAHTVGAALVVNF